jgi:hypothetical protein
VAVNRHISSLASGNSQAQRIGRPDSFLTRRKYREKEPVTQGVRALGLAVGLEDIDDVPGVGRGDRTAGLFLLVIIFVCLFQELSFFVA